MDANVTTIRCHCCHRVERWHGEAPPGRAAPDRVEVVVPGGERRPREAAPLTAWRLLRRVRQGELGPVVGACEACGQPLVANDTTFPPMDPWEIATPAGPLLVGREITGPDGPIGEVEAERWLEAQFPKAPWTEHFRGSLPLVMLLPLTAVVFVVFVLSAWYTWFFLWVGMRTVY